MKLPVPTGTTNDPEQLRTTMPSGMSSIKGPLPEGGRKEMHVLYFQA